MNHGYRLGIISHGGRRDVNLPSSGGKIREIPHEADTVSLGTMSVTRGLVDVAGHGSVLSPAALALVNLTEPRAAGSLALVCGA